MGLPVMDAGASVSDWKLMSRAGRSLKRSAAPATGKSDRPCIGSIYYTYIPSGHIASLRSHKRWHLHRTSEGHGSWQVRVRTEDLQYSTVQNMCR